MTTHRTDLLSASAGLRFVIIGRNREKSEALAGAHAIERVGTDLDAAFASRQGEIFFDAVTTQMRASLVRKAIHAGKAR